MSPPPKLQVTAGFVLLTVWFVLANGLTPMATVFTAAAVHELGHLTVLRLCGARAERLRLSALGAALEVDRSRLSYGRELAAVLAGPGANLLCAVGLTVCGGGRWTALVGANLILCAFNLLPVAPLDGGRALYLFLAWRHGPGAGEAAVRWTGTVCAGALAAALGYVMWRSGGSLWLLPAAAAAAGAALASLTGNLACE